MKHIPVSYQGSFSSLDSWLKLIRAALTQESIQRDHLDEKKFEVIFTPGRDRGSAFSYTKMEIYLSKTIGI